MKLQLGNVIGRAFSITWRHRWLWLLGVVGGGGGFGGFSGGSSGMRSGTSLDATLDVIRAQARATWEQHAGLLLSVGLALLVVGVLVFLVYCVCVPASIWGTLTLDAGRPARLADAWGYGRSRFGAFVRLGLLRVLIGLPGLVISGFAVANLGRVFLYGTNADLGPAFALSAGTAALAGLLGLLALVALVWSERVMVLLDVGAVDAIRSGWALLRHSIADTLVFGLCMGFVAGGVGIAVAVGLFLVAIPGATILVVGLIVGSGTAVGVGVAVLVVLAIPVALVGAGYAGSLVQAAYALAARDLCIAHGLPVLPGLLPAASVPAQ